jgi:hypothetical protein
MVRPSELFKSTIPSFGTVSLKREGAKEYSDRMIEKNGDPLLDAIKFISGGEKLGTSIVANAKNNIVNFNRANILPKQQNLESLISNISSNTFNNATNIYNNAPNQAIRKEDKDSKSKLNLKFISEFIKFFGSKDVEKSLKKNLKLVRNSLVETFDVAVLLRKAIKKIADELKNISLSGFGGGGGGSLLGLLGNLIGGLGAGAGAASLLGRRGQVPAGTQLRPPTNTRMPKLGGRIGLGLSALGLGAGAVSALDQPEVPSAQPAMNINELVLQKFNSILDRFDKAIDSLARGKEKPGKQAQKPSAPGAAAPGTGPGPGPGLPTFTPPPTGQITGDQAKVESEMFDYLKKNYGENVAYGMLSNAMRESGYRTNAPEGGFFGMFQLDKNREARFKEWAKSQGLDPMDRGAQLRYGVIEAEESGTLKRMKSAKTPEEASSIFYNEFERAAYSKPIKGAAYDPNNPHETLNRQYLEQIRSRQSQRVTPATPVAPSEPKVKPQPVAPAAKVEPQLKSQVTVPPQKGNTPQVAIVPFDAGQSQVQPAPVASKAVNLSGSSNNGPKIAFLSSKNSDSYSGLSAKMIYNIV